MSNLSMFEDGRTKLNMMNKLSSHIFIVISSFVYVPCVCTNRYGLSQFVVICPTEGQESLHSQAQANLMISSVSIALNNTGW